MDQKPEQEEGLSLGLVRSFDAGIGLMIGCGSADSYEERLEAALKETKETK